MTNHSSISQTLKKDSTSKQVILFVCEHGAARSTIAAAYFNKLAKETNLDYIAIFRGTDPDTSITTETKKGLLHDGFDIKDWQPQLVTQTDINNASQIITFDCTLSLEASMGKTVYQWNGIPPISKDYQAAKIQIVDKVRFLIHELENKNNQ